jgi:ABC-type transport system involved in multi-copper enzyme maturation permease subunit
MSGRVQGGNGNAVSVGDLVGAPGPLSPWAKAGLIITQSARPGARYAAVMLTGAHGVHLQYDYTGDVAGSLTPATGARWLRLARTGTTVTGYESADGAHWTELGSVRLAGLRASVRAGLFVASPQNAVVAQQYLAPNSVSPKATGALARFDRITTAGGWSGGAWSGADVGANTQTPTLSAVGYHPSSDGGFQISGSGDIGPAVGLPASFTVQPSLTGVFIGLIVLVVLGVMFITVEYRRGLIQTTLVATPRRGRVLAAKALVIAVVTFVVGAAACAVAIPLGAHLLRSTGNFVYPISTLTRLRVIAGVGALLAVAAVLALAVGTMIRRSAGAVVAVIVAIVLPYILSATAAVPDAVAQWLMRLTPAAAFAVEQTIPRYHQVDYLYAPSQGFYPLSPGAGMLVLCAYAALALALATRLLNSRDA